MGVVMSKPRENIMIKLRGEGLTFGQIAARVRVTEGFVRAFFGSLKQPPPAKPNGNRYVYQREALESVLRRKERVAVALANDISNIREQIDQLSALEASRRTLHQAIKGER